MMFVKVVKVLFGRKEEYVGFDVFVRDGRFRELFLWQQSARRSFLPKKEQSLSNNK